MTRRVLFDNGESLVEVVEDSLGGRAPVITFASLGQNDLAAPGFGETFLLRAGFCVINVKKRRDSWYQDLSAEALAEATAAIRAAFPRCFTYGTSMGGYGALFFARALGARALAISPRISIDPRFRQVGTAALGERVALRHPPLAAMADRRARHVVLYDPWDALDRDYVGAEIAPLFPAARLVRFPHAGHPAALALLNVGQLKPLVRAAFGTRTPLPERITSRGRKRAAPPVLHEMANHAARRGRLARARALNAAALAHIGAESSFRPVLEAQAATLAAGLPDPAEAAFAAEERLILRAAREPLHRRALEALRRHDLPAALAALETQAPSPALLRLRRYVLRQANDLPGAIAAARALRAAEPANPADAALLAALLAAEQAWAEAAETLAELPGLPALRWRCALLEQAGEAGQAARLARRLATLDPTPEEAARLLGLLRRAGDHAGLREAAERRLAAEPANLEALRARRDALAALGEPEAEAAAAAVLRHPDADGTDAAAAPPPAPRSSLLRRWFGGGR